MRYSTVRSLLRGIKSYNNASCYRKFPEDIRSIRMAHSTTQPRLLSNDDERREMMSLWPDLLADLTQDSIYSDIPEAMKWMKELLHYNVPCGKQHRGLIIIHSYRMLARSEQLTDENIKLARILAWCHEIGEAFLFMQDDIMDHSETRQGQLCWHLRDNVGIRAVNDSIILEHAVYQLLKRHFDKHECYMNLVELAGRMTLSLALGQVLDMTASNYINKRNLDIFTMERFNLITKYRGTLYFYLMPVKWAMYFAGITDAEMYRQIEPILLDLGYFYIVQNDYLDCYGDPDATGKNGTDIQTAKCSWLIVTALQHATPEQKEILQNCYGFDDPEKVANVKKVYDELGLPTIYANYEEKALETIKTRIKELTCDFPKELFHELMMLGQN